MNEDDLRDLNDAIDDVQEAFFYLEGGSPQMNKKRKDHYNERRAHLISLVESLIDDARQATD
jgi:hypothetical protein